MVMVANKKSQDQMTEDLSLFLGNNTIRFTVWLHGVLDKLRSVTTEPSSLKSADTSIFDSTVPSNKSSFSRGDERRHEAAVPPLAVSSSRPEKRDSRVSASSQEQKSTNVRHSYDDGTSTRLMSTVKPLREPAPSEDVIDIRRLCEPEVLSSIDDTYSPFFRNSLDKMSIEDENFRKRKLPVVSSVVKVKRFSHDGEEEEEEPSLPPSKQANKNLILKAISEAQESVTKTTNYSAVPQKQTPILQTLPVAPRTRTSQEELLAEMVQGQSRAPRISPPVKEEEAKGDGTEKLQGTQQRQLLSRLQIDPVMVETMDMSPDYYDMESMVHADTRSFILKKPKLSEEIVVTPNQESGMKTADALRVLSGHLMQTRDLVQPDKPASPKFIVTLDGVPSPPGYMSDQEEEMCFDGMKSVNQTAASNKGLRGLLHPQQLHLMSRQLEDPDGSFSNAEMTDLSVAQKPEKLLERCKYWPACKNGDECVYHHPISPCKAFPNCKFAEKCLFVHPNCKYDAKCTKPDCPFTHMSRRIPVLTSKPVPSPAPSSNGQLCRYFPACKKMECPFYHPKLVANQQGGHIITT
nr:zinc finger CCCH domain-containing protein 14 [Peromyscus maniculatus bairdii]